MTTYSNGPLTLDDAGPMVWTQPHTFDADVIFNEDVTIGSTGVDNLVVNAGSVFNDDVTFAGVSIVQLSNITTFTINSAVVTFGATAAVTFVNGGSVTFSTSVVTFNNDVVLGSSSADDVTVNADITLEASVFFSTTDVSFTGTQIVDMNVDVTLNMDGILHISSIGLLEIDGDFNWTAGTSATAGGIAGYLDMFVNGVARKMAFYAV